MVEVTDRFEDGRLNIVVEGRERFRLVELTEGRSFQTGTIEPRRRRDDPPTDEDVEQALALFRRLVELTGAEVEIPTDAAGQPSFVIGSRFELAAELKLELLEESRERVRLVRLCEILETLAEAVERQREIASARTEERSRHASLSDLFASGNPPSGSRRSIPACGGAHP